MISDTFAEYQELAARTAKVFDMVPMDKDNLTEANKLDLAHAALGLTSEAGEVATTIKATIIYGKPLDTDNLVEELGDLLWFASFTAHVLGFDLGTIAEANIAKLRKRYPEGYSDVAALVRLDKPDEPLTADAINALMMP